MAKANLKPCPFCGGTPLMHDQQVSEDCVETWVQCSNCGARTEPVEGAYSERPMAAYEWNHRATAPAATLMSAQLAEAAYDLLNQVSDLAMDEVWNERRKVVLDALAAHFDAKEDQRG